MRLPKIHQYQGYIWARQNPRGMILDSMRTGKTFTAAMSVRGEGPGIIACPANAKFIWRDEWLLANPGTRVDVAKGRAYDFVPDADVYVINYDILPHNFDRIPYHAKYNWIITDEFHRLKNPEAKRTGAAQALIRNARIAHPLSGTPMPSRPIEWWPVLHALGVTEMDWLAFAYRYADAWPAPWAKNSFMGVDARGVSNLDELRTLLSPHFIRRTKEDVIPGYQPPEVRLISFDRPVDKRESAFTMDALQKFDNPLLSLEGLAEVLEQTALNRLPDCVDFIEDRLEEEAKVIVFYWNKSVGAALELALQQYGTVKVDGSVTQNQREHARLAFNQPGGPRVFLGNIISASEALDLSIADVSIFVQWGWVPATLLQAIDRTESMRKVGVQSTAFLLTTENSIDHYQLTKILSKSEVINAVLSTGAQLR